MKLQPTQSSEITMDEHIDYYKDAPVVPLEEYGVKNAIHGANRAAKRDYRKPVSHA